MDGYRTAFEDISSDPRNVLVVVVHGGEVVGTLQSTVIPGLARGGALRAQIEAVRVAATWRSRGLGGALIEWAIEEATRRGCALVQLTSDSRRVDAHRFYTVWASLPHTSASRRRSALPTRYPGGVG
ncbi:GNAT family N-acetyltransferase [Rhodococcoides fascians]|uniref:GNAT family N-acetyltransferase n=1 Tax=Rhodococcoides fascians TaxID=1828 RepID=UPI001D882F8E|nr:GNAT family N-acetyltransferase [Rhodococcus fascians]CAH0314268.1 Aminoalkylphosphonate N-acetyltransferase [Rhodococcus fascians]